MSIAAKRVAKTLASGDLSKRRSVVDLGNQTYAIDQVSMRQIVRLFEMHPVGGVNIEQLRELSRRTPAQRPGDLEVPPVRDFYSALGFSDIKAIDISDRFGSLVMDLNVDLAAAYNFRQQFDLVTNLGVSEHLFNQAAFLKNMHSVTEVGGLMLHVLPFTGYINHGFFNYQPRLFEDLAYANGYELLHLSVADLEDDLLDLRKRTELATYFYHYSHLLPKKTPNTYVVALLKKTHEGDFAIPLQGKYKQDLASEEVRGNYKGQEEYKEPTPTKGFFTPQPLSGFKGFLTKAHRHIKLRLLGMLRRMARFVLRVL